MLALPSSKSSSTPVTVTVWAVSQLAGVKVRVVGVVLASPVSSLLTVSTTLEVGWALRTTVKLSLLPDSSTVAVVLERVNPAASSSVV